MTIPQPEYYIGAGLFSPLTYHLRSPRNDFQYLVFAGTKLNPSWSIEVGAFWGNAIVHSKYNKVYTSGLGVDVGIKRSIIQLQKLDVFGMASLGYHRVFHERHTLVGTNYILSSNQAINRVGLGPGIGLCYSITSFIFVKCEFAGQVFIGNSETEGLIPNNEFYSKQSIYGYFFNRQLSLTIGVRIH